MENGIPEMADIVFDLGGAAPPATYPFALWAELSRLAPQLAKQKQVGVLPLRLTANSAGMLLPRRTRLIVRVSAAFSGQALASLSEQRIEVEGCELRLGTGVLRLIQPHPTLHAQMVAGEADESLFIGNIREQLSRMSVSGGLICGKRHTLANKEQSIHGFSLVIHDLKPDASLKLQYAGLGDARQFGCGIFIPYKVISGLNDA